MTSRDDDATARDVAVRFGSLIERVNRDAAERDRAGLALPAEMLREAAKVGLLGFGSPEAIGGGGRDASSWASVLERVAFLCQDLAFCPLLCATPHIAEAIFELGDAAAVENYARPMMRGDQIAALALYEDTAEPLHLGTTARHEGDSWVLGGRKSMVTGGMIADTLVVFARDVESEDVVAFAVSPDDPGVERTPLGTMGARSSGFARLALTDVRLGEQRLLCGADGLGWVNRFFEKRRWEEAAILVGSMQAALEASIESLRTRIRGGRPLVEYPNVLQQIGLICAGVESSRAVLQRALATGDGSDGLLGMFAKHHATERATEMALALVRLQGAAGYSQEHRWERYLRDVLATLCASGHQDTLLRAFGERAVLDVELRALRQRGKRS